MCFCVDLLVGFALPPWFSASKTNPELRNGAPLNLLRLVLMQKNKVLVVILVVSSEKKQVEWKL